MNARLWFTSQNSSSSATTIIGDNRYGMIDTSTLKENIPCPNKELSNPLLVHILYYVESYFSFRKRSTLLMHKIHPNRMRILRNWPFGFLPNFKEF